ncbi:hypothetical protein L209DRAFT_782291 [Thermothelomyces heterothallicus CBS 203.75]
MQRTQQSSIRSFFRPRPQPEYTAPPSTAPPQHNNATTQQTSTPPPPPPPPPPDSAAVQPVTIPVTLPPNGVPVLPSPPSIPSGATIVPLAEEHVPALRRINSLLLPVPYPDSFYARALEPLASGLFSRAILWQDSDADTPKVIGGLICRLEPNPFLDAQGRPLPQPSVPTHSQKPFSVPPDTPYHAIYIQSLALLSPYRSLGLAAAALEHIIASASLLPEAGSNIDARTIYAHVWTENEEGLKWYEARGFAREGTEPVKGYYFKLRPDSAWVVRRHIGPAAASAAAAAASTRASETASGITVTGPRGADTKPSSAASAASQPHPPESVLAAAVNLPPISSAPPPIAAPAAAPPAAAAAAAAAHATASATTRNSSNPPPPTRRLAAAASPSPAPSTTSTAASSASSVSISYQNTRPQTEWNDLPPDMVVPSSNGGGKRKTGGSSGSSSSSTTDLQGLLSPNSHPGAGGASGASSGSRSSSTARKKRERTYPSAAFGA